MGSTASSSASSATSVGAAAASTASFSASSRSSASSSAAVRATPDHCHYAFESIARALASGDTSASPRAAPPPPPPPFDGALSTPFFCCIKKHNGDGRAPSLRGCIGSLSPRPHADLWAWARKSAFGDGRFAPVSAAELPHLQIAVSLLVCYEYGKRHDDFVVGQHGIIIKFSDAGVEYSAVYLPEVLPENGWTKREAVDNLIRKAGYVGAITDAVLSRISLTRYQSSRAVVEYAAWDALRNGNGGIASSKA